MAFSKKALIEILEKLSRSGVEFVIIGSTSIELALNREVFEGDLDLFVINPSPLTSEDFYRDLAEREKWEIGVTELGTLKLIASVNSETVEVELYENIMDFNIPEEIISNTRNISLNNLKVKALYPEQYFVLKARQGIDPDKVKQYYRMIGRINTNILNMALDSFGSEKDSIANRLRSIGLKF
ncbi:nucleotidyltransferase [Thermogladius sp. 4427co]|uniref:nucleotidyltransferase n=1 Tax=Thermogladius sp. 4427co TaxID=3450718 RepID=UPI003F7A52C0